MKIGIDIRCLQDGRNSGVEEYAKSLLIHLFQKDRDNRYILFLNSFGDLRCDMDWVQKFQNVSIKRFRIPNKLLNFCMWYFRWPKIDRLLGNVDVFFAPNINFIALSKHVRFVLTMHDLSFELFPETFSWKRRLWHAFTSPKSLCRRAESILSVSRSTANDIRRFYGITEKKVFIIHSGVNEHYHEMNRNDLALITVKEKYHLPYHFILFLGTLEPRKNIPSLIRAYNGFRKSTLNSENIYKLVIAGSSGWKSLEIFEEIRRSPFSQDILFLGYVADEDKESLYNLASVFVYPSLYEGFGFPILEAFRCGVPVITSDTSSLPEIAEDAALLIDPQRPDDLRIALEEVIASSELRQELKDRGKKRANAFLWHKTAEETLRVFESIHKQT